MKTPSPARSTLAVALLCFVTAAPWAFAQGNNTASDTEKKEKEKEKEPVRVRFICAVGAHPIKFKLDEKGIAHPYYEEGAMPPEQIFYKEGKDYKRVGLNENAAPGRCVISADKQGRMPSVFFTRKIVTAKPGNKDATASNDEYTPLVTVEGLGGKLKDALVCLYNPNLNGNWVPPKTLVLDASTSVVPEGGALLINLSAKTAALRIGSGAPITLKPGEHGVIQSTAPAGGQTSFKLAVSDKGVFRMVGEYGFPSPSGSRQVITLFGVDEKVSPAGLEWFSGNL